MTHNRKISVVGLGYVGLTTAVAFSQIGKVVAYDKSSSRISELKLGHDKNMEVSDEELKAGDIKFTTDPKELNQADFHIITVPTPLDKNRQPDLSMLLDATRVIAKQMNPGDIVVYESTVYPGATEEQCIPVLEHGSKLIYKKDFTVGFSPERINPADKEHCFQNIVKIVSGTNKNTVDIISEVYKTVVKAGVYPVSSMRVAEAAKVLENTQRDINIALMNDIAILFHRLGLDTSEVLSAIKTKWNYIPFKPGLVGGHCIGVNSYYLMHKAEEVGYHSDIIMAGRKINESMAKFIAEETIKCLIHLGISIKRARVAILGLTYKENCSDLRDTRVIDVINELKAYSMEILVHDPIADSESVKNIYDIELQSWESITDIDAILLCVAHKQYIETSREEIKDKLNRRGLIMDIKEIFNDAEFADTGILLWRL